MAYKRKVKQKLEVVNAWKEQVGKWDFFSNLPLRVIMTRFGSHMMDSDNLTGALKSIRDAVADCLCPGMPPGRADGIKGLEWEYRQEKGPKQKIIIEVVKT